MFFSLIRIIKYTVIHLLEVDVACVLFFTQSVCMVPNQITRNIYHKQMNNGVARSIAVGGPPAQRGGGGGAAAAGGGRAQAGAHPPVPPGRGPPLHQAAHRAAQPQVLGPARHQEARPTDPGTQMISLNSYQNFASVSLGFTPFSPVIFSFLSLFGSRGITNIARRRMLSS